MISRARASIVLAASALLLPACLEADMQADLKADGSGTLGVGMKFTDKFVEIVKKMEKVDPKQDVVKQAREGMMRKPDEAMIAAWEKAGLKVLQFENVADEKRLSSSMKVEFRNLELLKNLDQIKGKDGGSPVGLLSLTKDDKGVYTLSMGSPEKGKPAKEGEEEEDEDEAKPEKKEGGKPEAADPEAEAKKAAAAMAMMGELMGEMQNFKFTVALKVPGEVVDFEPGIAASKEGSTVTWKFDFASMMQAQMAGGMGEDSKGGMGDFKVRFRMPEGQSIPESALTKAPAPKEAPREKPAEAPKAPAPAPGGDK
jgi:hypothetical protein